MWHRPRWYRQEPGTREPWGNRLYWFRCGVRYWLCRRCTFCGQLELLAGFEVGDHRDCPPF